MDYWKQRAVTEKLIAKRKSNRRQKPPASLWCGKPIDELDEDERAEMFEHFNRVSPFRWAIQ